MYIDTLCKIMFALFYSRNQHSVHAIYQSYQYEVTFFHFVVAHVSHMSFYFEAYEKRCHYLVYERQKRLAFAIPALLNTVINLFSALAVYLQYKYDE